MFEKAAGVPLKLPQVQSSRRPYSDLAEVYFAFLWDGRWFSAIYGGAPMSENSKKDHHNRRRGNHNMDSPSHIIHV